MRPKQKESLPDAAQTAMEDLLKAVAHGGDLQAVWTPEVVLPSLAGSRGGPVMARVAGEGFAEAVSGGWRLTASGRTRALELLRAHRILETYLARKEGLSADQLHARADVVEHAYTAEGINQMADALGRPRFDPHGDPIPERTAELGGAEELPLAAIPQGGCVRIVHLEDEPEADFLELSKLGLAIELPLRVLEQGAGETVVELAGDTLRLPSRLAALVEVRPLSADEAFPESLRRLSILKPGERGRVAFLSSACQGPERRRLLDFGLVPGSEVRCEFTSPMGSPVAYSLRGSILGLRREQARNIFIESSI